MRHTIKALQLFIESDEEVRRLERGMSEGGLSSAYKWANAQARLGNHDAAAKALQPFRKELTDEHKKFAANAAAQHASLHLGDDSERIVQYLHPHRHHLDEHHRDMLDHHAHRRYEEIHRASVPVDEDDPEHGTASRAVPRRDFDSLGKSLASMRPHRLAQLGFRHQVETTKGPRTRIHSPSYETDDRERNRIQVHASLDPEDRVSSTGIYHTTEQQHSHRVNAPASIEHDFHPNGKVKKRQVEYHSATHHGPEMSRYSNSGEDTLHREGGKPARITHHYNDEGHLTKKVEEHHLGGRLHRNEGPARTTEEYHPAGGDVKRRTHEWHLWGNKHRHGAPAHIETDHEPGSGRVTSKVESHHYAGDSIRSRDNPPDES